MREPATTAHTTAPKTRNRVRHRAKCPSATADRSANTRATAVEGSQAAIKEHQQDGKWRVYRTAEYTLYPYNQEPEPAVDCAPLRTTDIQLQPGETITDVALEDTERWMATPAASGDPHKPSLT